MNVVAILDYGVCNLDSIARAIDVCGGQPRIVIEASEIKGADRIILPGVGSFDIAMKKIKDKVLDQVLLEELDKRNVPLLGICLGMQLLSDKSEEGTQCAGLGLINGDVELLSSKNNDERIPHIGWNSVEHAENSELFKGIKSGSDFYFVHSYHFNCKEPFIIGKTPYCNSFASAVCRENIMGVQFHPEKSQRAGFALLKNFLSI
jgi:imidazole glycerol-phosphate synthase subunit HisH